MSTINTTINTTGKFIEPATYFSSGFINITPSINKTINNASLISNKISITSTISKNDFDANFQK